MSTVPSRMASAPSRPEGAILMVANYPPDVGYAWWLMESFWAQIARHFAPLGRRCLLAYPRLGHLSQTIREAPIEVVELDYADRSRAGLAKLEAFVRTREVRSLYLTDQAPLDLLYGRLRRWGVRRIVVHDHTPGERSVPSRPRRALKRILAQSRAFSADRYIGVSRFVHRRFETIGLPPRRCSFVHNGIVPIGRSPACRGYVARHFPVAEDSVVVVSTGRATYYKGVDFLVRCAVRLAAVCERAPVFLHVGDGPDLEAFREGAREARLGDRFLFAGRRSDVREILQSCHIGLHASHGEAFSLSILEYMSAGLASVAPNHCGNPEAIRHGVDGLLYRPGDLAEAVSALERLVADRELRERLGRAAMQRVEDHFTLERANQAFREEIAQAL